MKMVTHDGEMRLTGIKVSYSVGDNFHAEPFLAQIFQILQTRRDHRGVDVTS